MKTSCEFRALNASDSLRTALAIVAGYVRDVPILRGARLSSTAAIVGSKVIGGMRLPDEFVRHRVLDLVGDLALAGAPLLGRVTAVRPSHEMELSAARRTACRSRCMGMDRIARLSVRHTGKNTSWI